jgi:ATP-dependent Lhr-like helicase
MAATDPANPYGHVLAWPPIDGAGDDTSAGVRGATRTSGALAVLVDGRAAGYLRRGGEELLLMPPADEPRRTQLVRTVARALRALVSERTDGPRGLSLTALNGVAAPAHPLAPLFVQEGFLASASGLQVRPAPRAPFPAG